jgi:hypothetical protein
MLLVGLFTRAFVDFAHVPLPVVACGVGRGDYALLWRERLLELDYRALFLLV